MSLHPTCLCCCPFVCAAIQVTSEPALAPLLSELIHSMEGVEVNLRWVPSLLCTVGLHCKLFQLRLQLGGLCLKKVQIWSD